MATENKAHDTYLTYAQVAASPPSTPRRRSMPLQPPTTHTAAVKQAENTSGEQTTPRSAGAMNNTAISAAPPKQTEGTEEEVVKTPGPSKPRERTGEHAMQDENSLLLDFTAEDVDMTAADFDDDRQPRRYDTPTSEDWRNLSVHGDDSAASDIWRDVIGDTVYRDEVDVENFVTNGVDRFGDTIPGQEATREEARSKKRMRVEGSPEHAPVKTLSVRFRRHRNKPGTANPQAKAAAAPPTPPTLPNDNDVRLEGEGRERTPGEAPPPPPLAYNPWFDAISRPLTPSPPRLLSADKGKNVARHPAPAGSLLPGSLRHRPQDRAPQGILIGTNANTGPTTPVRLFGGQLESPTPAPRNGPSVGHPATHTRSERIRQWGAQVNPIEETRPGQVEVLPSFLAPPPNTQTDRQTGLGVPTSADRLHPHVTPATPGSDGYGFTLEPAGGFPTIHHAHPEGLIEDLALNRIDEAWKCEEGTILFVQVANIGYPDAHLRKPMHDEIYGVIHHITGETAFVPIAPQPEWVRPPGRTGTPKTWAIRGLTKPSAAELVRRRVLSSVWITLFVYERKLVIPRYLFTLAGYTTNHSNDIVDSIKVAFASSPIYPSILDLVQSHPSLRTLSPDDAATRVLASIEVRIDQLSNGNMQAAVFCDPPTGCGETWKQWRSQLMNMPFHSQFNPTALARRLELCLCCHSADHVTHKCPFPGLQGWNAPPAKSRIFGRARPQSTNEPDQQHFMPTTPITQHTFRGRGRGTGPYRGGRAMTPARGAIYTGKGM